MTYLLPFLTITAVLAGFVAVGYWWGRDSSTWEKRLGRLYRRSAAMRDVVAYELDSTRHDVLR